MEENRHKVYLTINQFIKDVLIIQKDYYPTPWRREHYHYNVARMNLTMSHADRRAYPRLYEAVKSFTDSDQATLDIVFNQPDERWETPPTNGNVSEAKVRICVEARELLKQVYLECGYNLNICIRGFVYRKSLHRGRHYPLNEKCDTDLKFVVGADGTTENMTINMVPGLFGLFQLNALFTVSLEWEGPGPFLEGGISVCRKLNQNFEIIARDNEVYKCHSEKLSEISPVFGAMLNSSMKEDKQMRVEDFDGNVIEAFLDYAYERTIQQAYVSAGDCFQLFRFANKYQIPQLASATRELLLKKDENWVSTETTLDLYNFSFNLQDNGLVKRALAIIRHRKKALRQMEEFQELPAQIKAILIN